VKKQLKGAICAAVLAIVAAGCNNFLKGGDLTKDPNNPLAAAPKQLFGSVQSNLWQQQSGDLARLTSLWMQQTVGVQRQMRDEYNYTGVVEGSFDAEFSRAYQGGGRLDLLKIDSIASIFGDSIMLGVSNVVEAWMIGTDADIWGDIPFSQADSFSLYPTPALDPQQTVYSDVQNLLSRGIANLTTGVGVGPEEFDLVYGGDPDKWIASGKNLTDFPWPDGANEQEAMKLILCARPMLNAHVERWSKLVMKTLGRRGGENVGDVFVEEYLRELWERTRVARLA